MATNEFTIDPEIRQLIPLLTTEERSGLEASLKADGCRDALVVWAEKHILLDGHNRFEICDANDVDQMGRAKPTYDTMPFERIEAMPVGDLADEDCHLYLWITNRSLPKRFQLLDAWGFRYITCLTWCKPSIGMGNYFRGSSEQILFGVKGSQPLKRKNAGTWFAAPRGDGGHSSKPTEFYDMVESCSPGPYIELFARAKREGWTAWGEDS